MSFFQMAAASARRPSRSRWTTPSRHAHKQCRVASHHARQGGPRSDCIARAATEGFRCDETKDAPEPLLVPEGVTARYVFLGPARHSLRHERHGRPTDAGTRHHRLACRAGAAPRCNSAMTIARGPGWSDEGPGFDLARGAKDEKKIRKSESWSPGRCLRIRSVRASLSQRP